MLFSHSESEGDGVCEMMEEFLDMFTASKTGLSVQKMISWN